METKATFSRSSYVLRPNLSVYLDLLRYFAASMVYLFHAGHFANYRLPFFGTYGGLGVAIFFVALPVWLLGVGLYHLPRKHAPADGRLLGDIALLVTTACLVIYDLTTMCHSTAALRQEFPTSFF